MSAVARNVMRMFGRPRGVLGRLGGFIVARTNEDCAPRIEQAFRQAKIVPLYTKEVVHVRQGERDPSGA